MAQPLRELQRDGELALLVVLGELLDDRKKAILTHCRTNRLGAWTTRLRPDTRA